LHLVLASSVRGTSAAAATRATCRSHTDAMGDL